MTCLRGAIEEDWALSVMEYLRILRRYWPIVVVATLIGAGAGYATSYFSTPEYQSKATLFVATQNGTSVAEAYQNNLFSQERVVSYASLATSEQVAARAVDQLKASITPGELRSKITATPIDKTVMLTVAVTDPDPAQAQAYAGAVSDQLVNLIGELETSRRGGTPAAGAVVVDDADYPTKATGLGWPMLTALGAVAGLVVGFLLAILAGVLDKRLRGREPIEEATGATLLGALPTDAARRASAVVDLSDGGNYAESLRELRNNLRFAAGPNGAPPKVIAVTSPAKGEGRTSVAVDLGLALAESGRSVVVVDGDLYDGDVAAALPLDRAARHRADARGVSTVLSGEHHLAESVIGDVTVAGTTIAVLPAGPVPPRPAALWAHDTASALLAELARTFDYVVIDTPPLGAHSEGANIAALGDGAILLAKVRSTRATALKRAVQTLRGAHVHLIGTVATFEPAGLAGRRHGKPGASSSSTGGAPDDTRGGEHADDSDDAPTARVAASRVAKPRSTSSTDAGESR